MEPAYIQLIIFLTTAFSTLLAWIGKRVFMRLDELLAGQAAISLKHEESMGRMAKDHAQELLEIHKAMKAGDDQLHDRITGACNRISRLEGRSEVEHGAKVMI